MLRIEVSVIGGSWERERFEKKLRRDVLRLVADLQEEHSGLAIAGVKIIRPRSK